MLSLVAFLVFVTGASSQIGHGYGSQHQHTIIDMKLNQMLRHIDDVGVELKVMDAAYKNLKQNGGGMGETAALLSARGKVKEAWSDNPRLCKPANIEFEDEIFGNGNRLDTKKFDCGLDQNFFLTQIRHSDERGVFDALCCKRKKGRD